MSQQTVQNLMVDTNADVTPSWVPSSDPGYLTSSSTQSKYLRSDANDDFSGTLNYTPDTGDVINFDGQSVFRRMTCKRWFSNRT